ncbi:hypothetical protein [Maricaulis sp. CAU 1757]
MILSRLTRAVRQQNWFAVALEFVIVVAGVLLAFQVTAWKADHETEAREHTYLARLAGDLRHDIAQIDAYMARIRNKAAAAERMIAYHEAEALPDLAAYYSDLLEVLYFAPHRPNYSSVEALKSSGDFGLLSNDRLVTQILDIEVLYADLQFTQDHLYQDLWAYLYETYADIGDFQLAIDAWTGNPDRPALTPDIVTRARSSQRIRNGLTLVRFNSLELLVTLQDIRDHAETALAETGSAP